METVASCSNTKMVAFATIFSLSVNSLILNEEVENFNRLFSLLLFYYRRILFY